MEIGLIMCCIILSSMVIWNYFELKSMKEMLKSIAGQVEEKKKEQGERYVQIRTVNESIQGLVNSINVFLEEQFEQRAEYEKRNQQAMQMMTNISHDIKTPLTVLGGYTEILKNKAEEGADREKIYELILKMKEKTDKSIRSINQLFEMAKIESGDYRVELQKQDIVSICNETILEYYDLLEEQGYIVHIDFPQEPLMVFVDKQAVSRILKNLIDNALKYGKEGKYLGIRVEKENGEDTIDVFVEDHGRGIQKKQCEDIFKRSYMAEKKDKNVRGSGLGLAISQNLASMMGSYITVESIPEERTVFCWRIKS